MFFSLPWLQLLLYESSESDIIAADLFFFWKFIEVPTILQPREQNRKESRRLRSQTSQVLVTPLPGLG
jgi:hypothetical protein